MDKPAPTSMDFAADLDFDEILSNPILDIAARFFEQDRYEAFRICYRSMRRIDDLVDDRKATGQKISAEEAKQYTRMINDWLGSVLEGRADDSFQISFLETMGKFRIPLWPWERLCRSMIYDLENNGFKSFLAFLRYTEGAAIAPAAVFVHLCGVRLENERYVRPEFDIRQAARSLAIFSYLVHILRDFQKDARRGLNYFAHDLLDELSISERDLERIASGGPISPAFRKLVGRYLQIADYYRQLARLTIDNLAPLLLPRYLLSLEIVYSLYHQIFERIDPEGGAFTEDELNPIAREVKARVELTVSTFNSPEK